MSEVDLLGLKALKAIAEVGSITGAARQLDWSKSSLSRRLASLESTLDITLVKRHAHGAELTQAGESYFDYANQILHLSEQGKRALDAHSKELTGKLLIRVARDLSRGWFSNSLVDFLKIHPKLEVEVLATDYETHVMDQQADLWIWAGEEPNSKLRYYPLGAWKQKIYIHKEQVKHYAIKSPNDLTQLTWLQSPLEDGQVHLFRDGEEITLTPQNNRLKIDSISSLAERVAFGDGVALLPNCSVSCRYHG